MDLDFTANDVLRSLGIELNKKNTLKAGIIARELYFSRYGVLPPKDLRTKPSGSGSAAYAVYPRGMRGQIEKAIINAFAFQYDLFDRLPA